MTAEPVTKQHFDEIVSCLPVFWGDRDVLALHHPMFIHEFGDDALMLPDDQGLVAAYLFGFVLPRRRLAYVHLVAVREDQRGRGLGRSLYEQFGHLARDQGCKTVKAITTPGNAGSIAFHRALGMRATEVADYAGVGRARVVFSADL